MAQIRYHKFQ